MKRDYCMMICKNAIAGCRKVYGDCAVFISFTYAKFSQADEGGKLINLSQTPIKL